MTREEARNRLLNYSRFIVEGTDLWEALDMAIEALKGDAESATTTDQKQITGKLNNPDNSLLKSDSDECKEQKSKLDCISRADAIAYIDRIINSGLGKNKSLDYIRKYISAQPSAETHEIRTETHGVCSDCISRQQAIEAIEKGIERIRETPCVFTEGDFYYHNALKLAQEIIELQPPVTPTEHKTTETMIVDGMEMEIDPVSYEVGYSHGQVAPTEKTGEWIDRCGEDEDYECSECGGVTEKVGGQYLYDYCPFCGAKMGGDTE